MDQEICLVGLNHRTAEVDIREKFAISQIPPLQQVLVSREGPIMEALVLSTCNRVEFLVVGRAGEKLSRHVIDFWSRICNQPPELLAKHVYTYTGLDAVNHVYTVAASLDSMVMGEPQILGQLKDAYRLAVKMGSTKVITNKLMHKAFSVAKRVRTETGIASSAVSISYAAVELAKHIFGELHAKKAMLVGAGEMAELAARHLLNSGVKDIKVCNRTFSRGEELAEQFNGTPIHFYELFEKLPEVDIIITSTGATQAVIKAKDIKPVLKKRKNKPMFFIDIAVPRDVDPDVNLLDNIYLYDIDDLQEVVEENRAQRQDEAMKAKGIIEEEVQKFDIWLRSLDLFPTIKDMLSSGEEIARRELKRSLKNLGEDAPPEIEDIMETLALSLSRKLFHEPITFLKRKTREEGSAKEYLHLTRRMFNLDKDRIKRRFHGNNESPDDDYPSDE